MSIKVSPDGIRYCALSNNSITLLEKLYPESPEWALKSNNQSKEFIIRYLEIDLKRAHGALTERDLISVAKIVFPTDRRLQNIFTERLAPHLKKL